MDLVRRAVAWLPRLAIVSVALVALVACGGESEIQSQEKTLRRSLNSAPESLDIHKFKSIEAGHVLRDLGEGLTSYTASGRLIPGVAQRWEVSPDGLQYTFFLRPNAKWSNGDDVVATDFVAAYRRLVTPDTGAPTAKYISMVKNALPIIRGELPPDKLGVVAIDDRTLSLTLEAPTPYMLQLLTHPSMFPIHIGSLKQHGERFSRAGNMVSNGAYALKVEDISNLYELERNPHYWDNESTWFNNVSYSILAEEAEINVFRAGELDVTANVSADLFGFVSANYPDQLKVSPTLGVYYYGFNLTKPHLSDNLKLRKALSMAIDRETLVRSVTGRGEAPSYGWVPPGVDNYSAQSLDYEAWSQEERNAEAQRLYAEAGYGPSNPLSIELRYNTMGGHGRIALAVQAMWRETLGFEADLVNEEFQVFLANVKQMELTEVFRLSWSGDYNDAQTFLQLVETDNPQNLTGYSNEAVDKALGAAAAEVNLGIRRGYLEEAERLALADHPVIPLYFYVSKHLVASSIVGWEPMPLDYHPSKHLRRVSSQQ